MTQKQIRRSYSNEFKRNAVELSEHPGRQMNEVAEKLGITEQILTRWRREHRRRGELSFPGNAMRVKMLLVPKLDVWGILPESYQQQHTYAKRITQIFYSRSP